MAILNGVEGSAHVEVQQDDLNWNGYILVDHDPINITYFEIAGPASRVVYEGPVKVKGKYCFANGKVRILNANYTSAPKRFRVEFRGVEPLNIVGTLKSKPEDYLP